MYHVSSCHQKLPSEIVIRNCHQKLSSEIVIKNCHQKLSFDISCDLSDLSHHRNHSQQSHHGINAPSCY